MIINDVITVITVKSKDSFLMAIVNSLYMRRSSSYAVLVSVAVPVNVFIPVLLRVAPPTPHMLLFISLFLLLPLTPHMLLFISLFLLLPPTPHMLLFISLFLLLFLSVRLYVLLFLLEMGRNRYRVLEVSGTGYRVNFKVSVSAKIRYRYRVLFDIFRYLSDTLHARVL